MRYNEVQDNVKIVLEGSRDDIELYLTLSPLIQSAEISVDAIRKVFSDRGIKFGINEDILELLEKEIRYNEKMLIASGTKPVNGKDGTINYLVEGNGTAIVKKGEMIGKIIPPEKGTEGITVFEKKIPVREVKEALIPDLIHVELSENEDILVAEVDGYISIHSTAVQIIPFFELEVSDNEFQAHVRVARPQKADDFGIEDLKKYLTENGIVHGILDQEIENIFHQERFNESVLVARGKEVIDDKDGTIKYFFDTMTNPFMDDRENIDYKELNLIQNVMKGEKLAEIIPPVTGETGYTVLGKEIPPKKGITPVLPIGKNTKPDSQNQNFLVSDIDGGVKLNGTIVEVDSVFLVKENVDYSTGNISFKGSIVINGDVKSGFKVKVKDDVQINGILEDAFVEAGGNVLLKNGFIGKVKGLIIAHGDVTVKFCENVTITAGGDIYINDYVMNCQIQTKGTLYAKSKTGLIAGGDTYAMKGIEANVVGNKSYIPTKLCVGVDMVTKSYLENNINSLEEIEKILQKLSQRKLIKKDLPENMSDMIDSLNLIIRGKEEENKKLLQESEEIEKNVEELKKGYIKIYNTVYPGTQITIYDKHMVLNEPQKSVWFQYSEEDIVLINM